LDAPPVAERRYASEIGLFFGVVLLYVFTFASIPTADGQWYVDIVDRSDYKLLLHPTAAGTQMLMYLLRRLLDGLRVPLSTLAMVQVVNAALAGAGVVVFYRVLRRLGSWPASLVGAALLAVSFGYWYFANGERQHLSLVVLLVIFAALIRARADARDVGWRFVALMGLLNAIGVALRQENFLFGFAAVGLLAVGRPWRVGARHALIYAAAGVLGTLVLGVVLALFSAWSGVGTFPWYCWYYFGGWLSHSLGSPQDYQAFEHATRLDIPRSLKGQLTALVAGTQVAFDSARGLVSLAHRKVASLVALTALAGLLTVFLAWDLWRARRLIRGPGLAAAVGAVVWLVTYAIFHARFWPTATKYHVVSLPPLVLLLMLGLLVRPAEEHGLSRWRRSGAWRALALVLVVFTINVWAGIRPWYQYGQLKDRLAERQARDARPGDLFISTESGIDSIVGKVGEHIHVKDALIRTTSDEVFSAISEAIRERLDSRRRVFVYNFVPSPYSLIAINQAPPRGSQPLSTREFEVFFDGLRTTYATRQVFSYWEEGKAPLYLFGERLEPFWELALRPPA
jgi:hypothetical protein